MASFKEKWTRFRRRMRGDDEVTGWDNHRGARRLLSILSGRDSLSDERYTTFGALFFLFILALASVLYIVFKIQPDKPASLTNSLESFEKNIKENTNQWSLESRKVGRLQFTAKAMQECYQFNTSCNRMAFGLDLMSDSSSNRTSILHVAFQCKAGREHCMKLPELMSYVAFPNDLKLEFIFLALPDCFSLFNPKKVCESVYELLRTVAGASTLPHFAQKCQDEKNLIWCSAHYLAALKTPLRSDQPELLKALLKMVDKKNVDTTYAGFKPFKSLCFTIPQGRDNVMAQIWKDAGL